MKVANRLLVRLTGILLIQALVLTGISQTAPALMKVSYPSPAAMEIQKYGEYPVGHFTGIPDIRIPLYEIRTSRNVVPLELQNHPSGFKPTMFNGSLGVAWRLNVGGRITRTVYGVPDDQIDFPTGFDQKTSFSNYSDYQYLKSIDEGAKDTEYDLFSFDAGIDAGNFVLKNASGNKVPLTTTYRPLKISYEENSTGTKMIAFTIINEQGTIFRFGKSLKTGTEYHELSQTSMGGSVFGFISSWLLTEIISSDRSDTISFSYVQSVAETKRAVDDKIIVNDLYAPPSTFQNSYSTYGMQSSDILVISEIKFKNGYVSFQYTSDKKKLIAIKVYPAQGAGTPIKTVRFSSSRYDNYTNYVKLDSLKILNATETDSSQKYLFTYYNNVSLPNSNVEIEKMTDWWGYYNQSPYSSILPVMTVPYFGTTGASSYTIGDPSVNRNPSELHTKDYMLESIRYPTGGKTKFEYELNKYYDNGIKDAGGLRVTKISNYNYNDTLIGLKSYQYGADGNGYGIPVLKTGQFPHFSFSNIYVTFSENLQSTMYRATTYNAKFTNALQGALSSPVSYEQVTEYTRDVNNNIGKTVYKYDYKTPQHIAFGPQYNNDNVFNLYLYKHSEWSFGKLVEKVDYKRELNGTFVEVQRLRNTYLDFKKEEIRGLRLRRYCYSNRPSAGNTDMSEYIASNMADEYPNYQYGLYYIESGDKKLQKSENIQYTGADSVKTVTVFYYNNPDYLVPTCTVSYNSEGDSLVLLSRTPLDKTIIHTSTPLSSTASQALDSMKARNILPVVQNEEFLNNTLQGKILNTYKVQNSNIITQHEIYQQIKTNLIEKKIEFLNFENNGNILHQKKAGNVSSSYQWGYNNTYPVVEILNAENNLTTTATTTTATQYGSLNMPASSASTSFTTTATGNIVLTAMGDPGNTYSIQYNLSGPGGAVIGTLCASRSSTTCSYPETVTLTSMAAGNYTLSISLYGGSGSYMGATYSYQGNQTTITTTGVKEFFYQGFEEEPTAITTTPYAGKKYYNGDYTVPYTTPNTRSYLVNYRYLDGSVWKSITKAFTSNMTLSDGSAIDEVRVYPNDALITTYTYEPLIGMTSQTHAAGRTTFYEYDSFGRLKTIRDQDKNAIKTLDYQYQKPYNQ